MPSELYLFATPATAAVSLALDDGRTLAGAPTIWENRHDAFLIALPSDIASQGALLRIAADGHTPFEGRGVLTPSLPIASLRMDDFHLQPLPPPPEPPAPPNQDADPEAIIDAVYELDDHDLATKEGCGTFTEDCCDELHAKHSADWGHIRKTGGQNQYNGHAVDALYLRWPTPNCPQAGVYDILHDSESPNCTAQFIYKGETDPTLWFYPA